MLTLNVSKMESTTNTEVITMPKPPAREPDNFNDIENNPDAQEWLLRVGGDMPPDDLLEFIYGTQQEYGDRGRDRRARLRANRPNDEESFIKPEEEVAYYDEHAKITTTQAMNWLKKVKSAPPGRER